MFFTVNLQQDASSISSYISTTLLDEIENTLSRWEKVLLYLNKRGAYSSLICEDCQYLFECPNCDTSLSVHHNPEHLNCHICNHKYRIPLSCPHCKGNSLRQIGIGTQQIEQVLQKYFNNSGWEPTINIYRFDSDSTKTLSSKRQALSELAEADIIIGTKMVSTGFNFEKIGCIWVILVEGELSYPSYNAEEKAYAWLKQLIGRGNRKSQKTTIILQTFIPKNPIITRLTEKNFKDFFTETLRERKDFFYPPYMEMVTLEYRHKDSEKSLQYIQKIHTLLEKFDSENNYQIIAASSTFKKNNTYHASMIVKGPNIRSFLKNIEETILRESKLSVIFS